MCIYLRDRGRLRARRLTYSFITHYSFDLTTFCANCCAQARQALTAKVLEHVVDVFADEFSQLGIGRRWQDAHGEWCDVLLVCPLIYVDYVGGAAAIVETKAQGVSHEYGFELTKAANHAEWLIFGIYGWQNCGDAVVVGVAVVMFVMSGHAPSRKF